MAIFEFCIAVVDEPEAQRKDEGDIITVREYPRNWGRKVIDEHLIVLIDIQGVAFEDWELRNFFKEPQYSDGHILGASFRDINYEQDSVNKLAYPSHLYAWDIQADCIMERPVVTAKRRFKVTAPPQLDSIKIKDKKYIYQPFKKASQLVQKFDGIGGNRFLEVSDVDCVSSLGDVESEVIILWKNKTIITDKYTNLKVSPQMVRDWIG